MSYPSRLSQHHYVKLSPFTKRMTALPEGESFIITTTLEGIKYLDYYLRAWAFSQGYEKGTFKVARLSPTSLCVTRRKQAFSYTINEPQTDDDSIAQSFALDELHKLSSEDQAIDKAHQARLEGKLTPSQALKAVALWHKMKGVRQ